MHVLRQSYLGSSPVGDLCLKLPPPSRPPPTKPLGKCYISHLPDELLSEILSYVLPKDWRYLSKDEEHFPLMLVSKTWQRIYEPILIRKIRFWSQTQSQILRRISKLLAVLESRPYLQSHPRSISLQLSSNTDIYRDLANVLERCRAVRCVSLHAYLKPEIWILLCAIKNLPALEELSLSGYISGPSIHLILEHFTLPSLKRLTLRWYGVPKSSAEFHASWPEEVIPISQHELEKLLPPSRYYTGNVTSLEFSNPSTPPYVTEHVLRWPVRLLDLSIVGLKQSTACQYYTTEAIQRLLDVHQRSLKAIKLGVIVGGRCGMPSFSNFPCLEELCMSAYNIIGTETSSNALRKLAAPNLRRLTMSFSTEDQHCESRGDFGSDQLKWMQNFASARKSDYPGSRLKKVIIEFNPDADVRWYRGDYFTSTMDGTLEYPGRDLTWPWEDLEQAKQSVAQHELTLEYSASWAKEEWDRVMRGEEVEHPDFGRFAARPSTVTIVQS